jgi:hypothetical protein
LGWPQRLTIFWDDRKGWPFFGLTEWVDLYIGWSNRLTHFLDQPDPVGQPGQPLGQPTGLTTFYWVVVHIRVYITYFQFLISSNSLYVNFSTRNHNLNILVMFEFLDFLYFSIFIEKPQLDVFFLISNSFSWNLALFWSNKIKLKTCIYN